MNSPQEFAELLAGFRRLEREEFAGGAALATLIRTQGSTFRRAGARMLVFADGSTCRGLSGGCPERDIVERGLQVMQTRMPQIASYKRDSVFDPMLETGCGGEIDVLIEPLADADSIRFIHAVDHCLTTRRPGFLATAFARGGQCLAPRPRRLVWSDGIVLDELDDAELTAAVLERGQVHSQSDNCLTSLASAEGKTEVMFERLSPPHAVLIIGVNAGSLALARLAMQLGWETTLVDPAGDASVPAALTAGLRLITATAEQLTTEVWLDSASSVVVMTHHLRRDAEYIAALQNLPLNYLGVIGSRSRATQLREITGLAPPRLRVPAGLNIGSETPEEIALSIAAEILAVRAGKDGEVLSAIDDPIH